MFDLDKEVHRWCCRMCPHLINRRSHVAELEDHIHCAISVLLAEKMSPEEAFRTATSQLGERQSLRAEYRKNRSRVLTAVCRLRDRVSMRRAPILLRKLALRGTLLLLIGAALMASRPLLRQSEIVERTRTLITALFSFPIEMLNEE